ncbi:protein CURVATURE THYLAKOID 1D, chloroplastic [Gossypium raimondii]|uniref:Cyanobacterial aminoacyl-tRNA synthetase CAAD domain-containing protein n=1 Tax=Gossypium raimondii TaxID=29730 RepID=A0A0D2RKI4_GOSRA|nr:protein CURVATURE THYLAKOID 1D, chloroplastic [Gossypium raimondii]KJB71200.1 hypothetical protein B456_011G110000 [Gossypium raimondii]KJB71201.1 hypothetical protein B456_011G110000 [Gossypium raimondii]KJB71202.1 hypothetical protein B456_011G110000 [Gossypium raimondii]
MEPLTTSLTHSISTLPPISFSASAPCLPPPQLSVSTARHLRSRVLRFSNLLPKATTSEEASSTGPNRYFGEDRDRVVTVEEVPAVGNNNVFNEKLPLEEPKVESAADEDSQMFDFLEKLNIKLDSGDGYSIILYGTGALFALWLASSLVGAIDSIPLFPKLMEVVGLGYTVWFSSRYLLFKKSREELGTKIEELKQQVLGSEDG